jgi:hypothetical protein
MILSTSSSVVSLKYILYAALLDIRPGAISKSLTNSL